MNFTPLKKPSHSTSQTKQNLPFSDTQLKKITQDQLSIVISIISKFTNVLKVLEFSLKDQENITLCLLNWVSALQNRKKNDYSSVQFLESAQKSLSALTENMTKAVEFLIEENYEEGSGQVEEKFNSCWREFIEVTAGAREQAESRMRIPMTENKPETVIQIMEQTWEQLDYIKDQYLQQTSTQRQIIKQLQKENQTTKNQLINMHNKYEQVLEDLEEKKMNESIQTSYRFSNQIKRNQNLEQTILKLKNQNDQLKGNLIQIREKFDHCQQLLRQSEKQCTKLKNKVDSLSWFLKQNRKSSQNLMDNLHEQKSHKKLQQSIKKINSKYDNMKQKGNCGCTSEKILMEIVDLLQKKRGNCFHFKNKAF